MIGIVSVALESWLGWLIMGNWRTVHLQGSVERPEWYKLCAHLQEDYESPNWGCLHNGGLFGLQNWAKANAKDVGSRVEFGSYGNLGEQDYSPEDVADAVREIRDRVAPSLIVRIDCGGDYESLQCVATVIVGEDGEVSVIPPMVAALPEELSPDEAEVGRRMQSILAAQGFHLERPE